MHIMHNLCILSLRAIINTVFKTNAPKEPMNVIILIAIYILVLNLIGYALMGIDKLRAKKRGFRIPEATLFVVAIIGGSIGTILGMIVFKHKTRKWYFTYGLPVILILQIALTVALFLSPVEIAIL